MFLYPLAITLILLSLFGKLFGHDRAVYRSVTLFTLVAAVFDFLSAMPEPVASKLHLDAVTAVAARILPFFKLGLGWVVPALIGLVIGLIIHFVNKTRNTAAKA